MTDTTGRVARADTPCPAESAGGYDWPETSRGSGALVSCNQGQTGNGIGAARICGNDGNWGAVQDYCNMMRCFGEISGNAVWDGTGAPQANVQGECLDGFNGAPLRDCYSNGQWGPIHTSPCVCTAWLRQY